jgi:hypothetical protein
MKLLAGELIRLTAHESPSGETVRRRLAEMDLKPWQEKMCASLRSTPSSWLAWKMCSISNWEQRRNAERARIKWLFTVDRARQKLGRAYPVPADLTSTAAAAA